MLKKVYKDEISVTDLVKRVEKELKEIVSNGKNVKLESKFDLGSEEKEIIGKCLDPSCGKPVYENNKSFYCSGYKEGCKFGMWKEDKFFIDRGKKITKSMAKSFLNKGFAKVKGLKKKNGSGTYDCRVDIVYDGKYVNFKVNFGK